MSICTFEFVNSRMMKTVLEDAYLAVTEMELWEYLRDNTFESFTFYDGPNRALHQQLLEKADRSGLHSGASFGITMRNMEKIAKFGFEHWKREYRLHS